MKKILFGIFFLSVFSMADGKLFDFSNAKAITGSINAASEVNKRIALKGAVLNPHTNFDFKANAGLKIYDFVEITSNLSTRVRIKDKESKLQPEDENFVKLGLDFKQYGKPGIKLEIEHGSVYPVLSYENKLNVYGVDIYTDNNLKIDNTVYSSNKLGLRYDIVDGVNIHTSGTLATRYTKGEKANFAGQYELGVTYDKDNIKNTLETIYSKVGYNTQVKLYNKDSSDVLYDKALIRNQFEYKVDENQLNVKGLSVTPKFEAGVVFNIDRLPVKFNNTYFYSRPALNAKYKVVDGFDIKAETALVIDATKFNNDKDPAKYSIKPSLELGLSYSF